MHQILLENLQSLPFPDSLSEVICQAITATLAHFQVTTPCQISVQIVDPGAIRERNLRFRGIDRATDVLSFPMLDYETEGEIHPSPADFDGEYLVLGDIVISLAKACAQAEEYGHSLTREVGFLTVHSMLHLLGFDHMEDEERARMQAKEAEILDKMGVHR